MPLNSDHQNSVALQLDLSSIRDAKRYIRPPMKPQSLKVETSES